MRPCTGRAGKEGTAHRLFRLAVRGWVLLAPLTAGAEPQPPWRVAGQTWRAVFADAAAPARCVLLSIPPSEGGVATADSVSACDAAGNELACRLVHSDESGTLALVASPGGDGKSTGAFYFGAGAPSPTARHDPNLRDPTPVRADVHRTTCRSAPYSLNRMLYLFKTAGPVLQSVQQAGFGTDVPIEKDEDEKKKTRQVNRLAYQRAWVFCPTSGVYRFALNSKDAAFLLVDGEPAAEWAGEHPMGDWHIGPAMFLPRGPRFLEIYSYVDASLDSFAVAAGWLPPGSNTVTALPPAAYLASGEAAAVRVERKDRTLHPDFSSQVLPAYAFRTRPRPGGATPAAGEEPVFVPVLFKDRSVNWMSEALRCTWHFEDGASVEGNPVRHILVGKRVHKATLEVRDALGFVARLDRTVDCRRVVAEVLPLDFEITSCPAVCYADEKVMPALRLRGELPGTNGLDVSWEVTPVDGVPESFGRPVALSARTVEFRLFKADAGSVAQFRWQAAHAGAVLGGGVTRFLKPPFAALPTAVENEGLYDAQGTRLVLLPHRWAGAFLQSPITVNQAYGRIDCIDDFLAAPSLPRENGTVDFSRVMARMVDGPDRPIVRLLALADWEGFPEAYGPLLKLAHVPSLIGADSDVVVLSLGLKDIRRLRNPAEFEKQAAALSDMVSGTMGRAVIWVTPPPYPGVELGVRPFAAAIQRVADARRIPVADVFTAFLGLEPGVQVFTSTGDLGLSQAGQNLVANLVARALLSK